MTSSLEATASTVQRLAVLLSAGVPPTSAWSFLDCSDPVVRRIVTAPDLLSALSVEAEPWRITAAAWSIATTSGAPLAAALRGFARALRSLASVERDMETAMAGPRATTKLVMLLPVVAVIFGMVLGFDPLRVLFTTVPGLACLGLGLALMLLALWWNRRLFAAATPRSYTSGLRCELVAIAVSGGGSIERAMSSVENTMVDYSLFDSDDRVEAIIALSVRAGVPAAELLRSEAEECRREAAAQAERAAVVLAVRLMVPLGLCILPAFMLIGVAPLIIAVLSSTVTSL